MFRIQQNMSVELMKEQEKEYAQALEADRGKRLEREKKEQMRREEENQKLLEGQKADRRKSLLSQKRRMITLPLEPKPTDERIQLRVRFPGNLTRQRSFHLHDRLEVGWGFDYSCHMY